MIDIHRIDPTPKGQVSGGGGSLVLVEGGNGGAGDLSDKSNGQASESRNSSAKCWVEQPYTKSKFRQDPFAPSLLSTICRISQSPEKANRGVGSCSI